MVAQGESVNGRARFYGQGDSMATIGIIGTGSVARAIATGLVGKGHHIVLGSREPSKARPPAGSTIASREDVVRDNDIVIIAIPYGAVRDTVAAIGPSLFQGKIVVDATNALGPSGLAVGFTTSAAEELAKQVPGAQVVKAFNSVFARNMSTGRIGQDRLTLFVAGDDAEARRIVMDLGRDIGFDPVEAGALQVARYLEPMGVFMINLGYGLKMGPAIGLRLVRAGR
ncbi:MAG TPA: NADPH-dependent F420 reductase [Thermoplasmata archaeon]|nr:NADPH-dependent F420 reductase [Thermoplasmata archaeon]HLA46077.1 NADPH-dependent F420 reductase [Thermoplasmata archaeon]HLF05712.1 NADPH-dependent F420 reductase [Thermoplasmata archaeon]